MVKNRIIFVIAAGFFGAISSFGSSLLTNGGFETGDFTGWTAPAPSDTYCQGVGSTDGGPPDFGCGPSNGLPDPGPHSGNFAAWLGAGFEGTVPTGTLSQSVATNTSSTYTVSFYLAATDEGGVFAPNTFRVLWNGSTIYSLTDQPATAYTPIVISGLSVTGSSTSLQFISANAPAYFVLDDVSVTGQTPEPASFILIGSAVAALGLLRTRRIV